VTHVRRQLNLPYAGQAQEHRFACMEQDIRELRREVRTIVDALTQLGAFRPAGEDMGSDLRLVVARLSAALSISGRRPRG
jgi:hypothetical protein